MDRNTDRFLARIKKPKPLTALPRLEGECSHPAPLYLKPRTPRTPLLGQFGVKNICGNVKNITC